MGFSYLQHMPIDSQTAAQQRRAATALRRSRTSRVREMQEQSHSTASPGNASPAQPAPGAGIAAGLLLPPGAAAGTGAPSNTGTVVITPGVEAQYQLSGKLSATAAALAAALAQGPPGGLAGSPKSKPPPLPAALPVPRKS